MADVSDHRLAFGLVGSARYKQNLFAVFESASYDYEIVIQGFLSLALLLAPLPSVGLFTNERLNAESGSCCCCKAGECRCGCEVPTPSSNNEDDLPVSRFCPCGDTVLSLPSSATMAPEQTHVCFLINNATELGDSVKIEQRFSNHLPLGPPSTVAALSTIILII